MLFQGNSNVSHIGFTVNLDSLMFVGIADSPNKPKLVTIGALFLSSSFQGERPCSFNCELKNSFVNTIYILEDIQDQIFVKIGQKLLEGE